MCNNDSIINVNLRQINKYFHNRFQSLTNLFSRFNGGCTIILTRIFKKLFINLFSFIWIVTLKHQWVWYNIKWFIFWKWTFPNGRVDFLIHRRYHNPSTHITLISWAEKRNKWFRSSLFLFSDTLYDNVNSITSDFFQ